MRVKEIEWIIKNWDSLSKFEQKRLDQYQLREQYDYGELSMNYNDMMDLFKCIDRVYNNYNNYNN